MRNILNLPPTRKENPSFGVSDLLSLISRSDVQAVTLHGESVDRKNSFVLSLIKQVGGYKLVGWVDKNGAKKDYRQDVKLDDIKNVRGGYMAFNLTGGDDYFQIDTSIINFVNTHKYK